MAFFLKNQHRPQGQGIQPAIIEQWIQVTQPAVVLPQSTTGQLFRVFGGKVLVQLMIATVTTVIGATVTTAKFTSKQLDNTGAVVGTAVDIASATAITSLEVGGTFFPKGDTSAVVVTSAGVVPTGVTGMWCAPQGEIYVTTSASTTGAVKYDIWYQPLDPGTFVLPAALTAGGILQAAI